jgi:hypothetical protein
VPVSIVMQRHKGVPRETQPALLRDFPDVAGGRPWDDRAVSQTVLIVDDHDGLRAGARAILVGLIVRKWLVTGMTLGEVTGE